jgi:preprotein translocase subunit Sec61beta
MAEIRRSAKGEGFQSAAGLMRYFDAEDSKAVKIPPQAVFLFCVVTVAIVGLAAVLIQV